MLTYFVNMEQMKNAIKTQLWLWLQHGQRHKIVTGFWSDGKTRLTRDDFTKMFTTYYLSQVFFLLHDYLCLDAMALLFWFLFSLNSGLESPWGSNAPLLSLIHKVLVKICGRRLNFQHFPALWTQSQKRNTILLLLFYHWRPLYHLITFFGSLFFADHFFMRIIATVMTNVFLSLKSL